ncbi:MFS transporter [Microcella daejeonensis]|uniref:MFS transporter n=1 Tax=Microcella daejeonensis TaxID=2994971 RepID=UPI0022702E8B|nr:MFS transporter [Microcella daejeonensis]WAB82930.1 MFS transporter [Microcella daejeonensis]
MPVPRGRRRPEDLISTSTPDSPPDLQTTARRGHFVDLRPLTESPAFARMWIGATVTGIGSQMTIIAVGLDIYARTSSTLAVSLVAAFALVPMVVFGLYGGVLADSFDRRKVALLSAIVAWVSTVALAGYAWVSALGLGAQELWPLYLLITLNTVASTMVGVARQAMVPRLVRRELLPAAGALGGISGGLMATVGPALAGVLVASVGVAWTYSIDAVLFIAAFIGLYTLPALRPEGTPGRPGLRSVIDGARFLKDAPNIRASFLLDIFAMTFGNPRVLMPAIGAVLLGGGAVTVGVLTSATAVGALLLGLLSGRLGAVRRQGLGVGIGVAAYGATIVAFGAVLLWAQLVDADAGPALDDVFVPGLVAATIVLALSGAADSVSMIYRNTMLQASVPDAMRGRLQGLFTVVVTGGPRIGDLYVGALSVLAMLWFPPLLGGVVIVVAAAVILKVQRGFREYDAEDPRP